MKNNLPIIKLLSVTIGMWMLSSGFLNAQKDLTSLFPNTNVTPRMADCTSPTALSTISNSNIRATVSNGGDLFWDGLDGQFYAPYNAILGSDSPVSLFAAGLWLGGISPAGNLRTSIVAYGRSMGDTDYFTGPLNDLGETDLDNCSNWDRIFKVTGAEIKAHLDDFNDNGQIDNPIESVMGWPGIDNPNFFDIYGFELPDQAILAPFWDENQDGMYTPSTGDYPLPPNANEGNLPFEMTWCVFNDNGGLHTAGQGDPLKVEIHLTMFTYDCETITLPNDRAIFANYKLINKNVEPLDSMYMGMWTDFDIGCFADDYIGSVPTYNAMFAYNQDAIDGVNNCDCTFPLSTYCETPPFQSVQFLNRTLQKTESSVIQANTAAQFYDLLGVEDADSGAVELEFPDDPNDPNGNSMFAQTIPQGDRRMMGSTYIGSFPPGAIIDFSLAFTYHNRPNISNWLGNYDPMVEDLDDLQALYNVGFDLPCNTILSNEDALEEAFVDLTIAPNPAYEVIYVQNIPDEVRSIQLFNALGQQVQVHAPQPQLEIKQGSLPNGVYVLVFETELGRKAEQVVWW